MTEIVKVKDLATHFKTESGLVKAVDGVCYHIDKQEIIGFVGESCCGKNVYKIQRKREVVIGRSHQKLKQL